MSSVSEARSRRFRRVGDGLVAIGYAYGRLAKPVRQRRRYRRERIGPLSFRVPTTWGGFEPAAEGDFVMRNRPTKHMIDGDILWYSGIAEIRVRRPGGRGFPALAPMDEVQRTVITSKEPLLVLLRVGRGMTAPRRAEAAAALSSVRVVRRGASPLEWPPASYGRPAPELGDATAHRPEGHTSGRTSSEGGGEQAASRRATSASSPRTTIPTSRRRRRTHGSDQPV